MPDIRKIDVKIGTPHELLKEFGIDKKDGGEVTLYQGPNSRLNRYLIKQYKRMIKILGGSYKGVPKSTLFDQDFGGRPAVPESVIH